MRLLIVTGMSGAGKSQVINFLEDQDWFCVDNLPPALIPKFTQLCQESGERCKNVALVVDIRGGEFFGDFLGELEKLETEEVPHELLFLDAEDEVLIRRYKESRRRHPLADHGRLSSGLEKERQLLAPIRNRATFVIDTSNTNLKKLKVRLDEVLLSGMSVDKQMRVTVLSFGFKYGLPLDADMVFDIRFLPNPYYVEELRPMSGEDKQVQEYIAQWPETEGFWDRMLSLVNFVLPQYMKEGRRQVVIAIGCTGGRHRSVYLANRLYKELQAQTSYGVTLEQRDVSRYVER
ncbi:MAG: RNase adapter RapZ [Negativicutes bacterium]|nr:RNase adapter RapZ [Negativicutes bacterium]